MPKIKPYCEPIVLPPGKSFNVEQVSYQNGTEHKCFYHFHEVSEVVLFEQVDGTFVSGDRSYSLTDQCLVFIPSMDVHHFELKAKPQTWQILQYSSLLYPLLNLVNEEIQLTNAQVITLNERMYDRYNLLIKWLAEFNKKEELINNDLLSVLIRKLATDISNKLDCKKGASVKKTVSNEKLLPLLDVIKREQRIDINLQQAASLCQLSPSYFSRYFKKVFHQNFSQYMLTYRLHIASRYLINTDKAISTICYELNFTHPSYFIAKFKAYFGVTPKQYRNM